MKRRRELRNYRIESLNERLERWFVPIVCKIAGHRLQQKMHCTICDRCRIVLRVRR